MKRNRAIYYMLFLLILGIFYVNIVNQQKKELVINPIAKTSEFVINDLLYFSNKEDKVVILEEITQITGTAFRKFLSMIMLIQLQPRKKEL